MSKELIERRSLPALTLGELEMKTRFRIGKEGLFGKPVLILQVFATWEEGPCDSYGGPGCPAGSGWRDAKVEDMSLITKDLK